MRGEGCGAVVLEAVSGGMADGDRVLAVIRGTCSQPGRTKRRADGAQRPRPGSGDTGARSLAAGVAPTKSAFWRPTDRNVTRRSNRVPGARERCSTEGRARGTALLA